MGQNKRYFWFKLFDDFFQSKRIKRLRNLAGGDTYTIIYLKMQLKALKTDGYLYFDGVMNDFAEELALDIDENAEDVKVTLQYLLSVGLIESSESGEEWYLTYMKNCIGSETASTLRSRKCREAKKEAEALQRNTDATQSQLPCNGEIDIDKEIDIDIDKEKDNNPPLSPLGETEVNEYFVNHTNLENVKMTLNSKLFADWQYIKDNPRLWACIKDWMEYKDARKPKTNNHYVNVRSMRVILNKFVSSSKESSVGEVVRVVEESMGNCYVGIVWDNIRPTEKSALDSIKID